MSTEKDLGAEKKKVSTEKETKEKPKDTGIANKTSAEKKASTETAVNQ